MQKGDIVYYAQIMPTVPQFEVIELKIRTINEENKWFVGTEKLTKHAYLFNFKDIDKIIFYDRLECLMKVRGAEEECKKKDSGERYYEED